MASKNVEKKRSWISYKRVKWGYKKLRKWFMINCQINAVGHDAWALRSMMKNGLVCESFQIMAVLESNLEGYKSLSSGKGWEILPRKKGLSTGYVLKEVKDSNKGHLKAIFERPKKTG